MLLYIRKESLQSMGLNLGVFVFYTAYYQDAIAVILFSTGSGITIGSQMITLIYLARFCQDDLTTGLLK